MKPRHVFILLVFFVTALLYAQNRPQEPKPPFDYVVDEVNFKNNEDDITLAGTITYPKTGSSFPAVILISGSGAQDRNSELLGHKPFLVIADHLTKNGIAVLRVDDRGTGKTEGHYNETGLDGFVRDTESAIEFLRNHKKINSKKIGLIGHSLGGTIAPIIASKDKGISFIILLAGPTMRGDKLMLKQKELIETQMGIPKAQVEKGQTDFVSAYKILFDKKDNTKELKSSLKAHFKKVFGELIPENQLNSLVDQLSIPWLADFIRHDPAPYLERVNCPVYAFYAEKDLQVPAKENLEVIESSLKSHNPNVQTTVMTGMNHLFQNCETGLPQEYGTIEETFSTEVLKYMTAWIQLKN